jgi:hypothetical protein
MTAWGAAVPGVASRRSESDREGMHREGMHRDETLR